MPNGATNTWSKSNSPSLRQNQGVSVGDVLAAVGAARAAMVSRFGPGRLVGAVTAVSVAVACSGARLLAPEWPPVSGWVGATPVAL
ncbi:hypothetical protein MSAR_00730 [Mycolicibacterium sarraceniae]|uniref:Uncharacterized protein n=1 Tax=Mycolicibacterium sarraceniae TaxID=1534348 RepID=A0A7I7SJ10_9MYCO|nr:hypothetical protein MSAR_00730 [Mycolicibacterium sarraceniae]